MGDPNDTGNMFAAVKLPVSVVEYRSRDGMCLEH